MQFLWVSQIRRGVDNAENGGLTASLCPVPRPTSGSTNMNHRIFAQPGSDGKWLQAFLAGAPDPVIITGKQGNILYANAEAERSFGYAQDELLGKPVEVLLPERVRGTHRGDRERYWTNPFPRSMGSGLELWGCRKDGSEFPVSISLIPIETDDGLVVAATVADLTALRHAQEELHRFFSVSLDLLCVTGLDGHFKRINPAWERTLGFSPDELLGKPVIHFVHPDDRQPTLEETNRLVAGMKTSSFENRLLCKDGSYKWFLWSAVPLLKDQLIYAAARDISERKALEAELRFLSVHDPLTSLFNRRYLEATLERELQRAARNEHRMAVIMIDIDHFKRLNDTYGHPAGDNVLRALGGFLQQRVRASDIPCRYGGEEFALILPETSLPVAHKRAELLRSNVTSLNLEHEGQRVGPITLSLGVAAFPQHGSSGSALLKAADIALYRAKKEGRNRTVIGDASE